MVSPTIIKKLHSAARNLCAFPDCQENIYDKEYDSVVGEICHIRAKSIKGPRYDPEYPKSELDEKENLILLCSKHHKIVDDNPKAFSVEELTEMKEKHESAGDPIEELSNNLVKRLVEASGINVEIVNSRVGKVINVQSTNQTGGITTGEVNIDKMRRRITQEQRAYLLRELGNLPLQTISVASMMGDPESIALAHEFRDLFQSLDWNVQSVSQIVNIPHIYGMNIRMKDAQSIGMTIGKIIQGARFQMTGSVDPKYTLELVVGSHI